MTTWPEIYTVADARAAIALYDRMRTAEPDADPEQVRGLQSHIARGVLKMIADSPKVVTRRDILQLAGWVSQALA